MSKHPPSVPPGLPRSWTPTPGHPQTELNLERITDVLVSVASGRFDVRAPRTNDGDPWDVLAYLANETAEEVQRLVAQLHEERRDLHAAQEKLHQTEKLAALGELAGGVAHELNQPLTVIQTVAELLLEKPEERIEDRRRELELISAASRRMGRIVSAIRTFGRQAPLRLRKLDIQVPIREALSLLGGQLEASKIEVRLEFPKELAQISGDNDALQQVFINLLSNARDILEDNARGEQRLIVIAGSREENRLLVRVFDNGPGVDENAVAKIFDPFFSTKSVGRGTGLGLSISHRIVSEHAGTLGYTRGPLGGACFELRFPAAEEDSG